METLLYQAALGLSIILLLGVLLHIRNVRRQFVRELARSKQHEINLRRELHYTNEQRAKQKESAVFFTTLLDQTNEAVLAFPVSNHSEPGTCAYANATARKILELTEDDWQNLECPHLEVIPVAELDPPKSPNNQDQIGTSTQQADRRIANNRIRHQIQTLAKGREVCRSTEFITKHNHVIPVYMHAYLLESGIKRFLVYILREEQRERSLRKSLAQAENRYQRLFRSALVGVAHYNAKHELQQVNPAWLRILGSPSLEEMRQLDFFESSILPEENRTQLQRGESVQIELPVDFNYWINEFGFVTNQRRKAMLLFFFHNLGRDENDQPLGHLVQVVDCTELRESEAALAMRQAQLLQSQKMASIGMMTGGIAHDFNNILTPILGYSEIGLDICEDNPSLHEFITEIHTATLRAKDLVGQILIYSRQSDDDVARIHLIPIIKEVAKQQSMMLAPDIEVRNNIRTKDDLVIANPTQMHQVLTNLATNAAFAMREAGGILELQLSTFNLGWRHRHEFPDLPRGTYVRLTIKDTGTGIPEEIRDRIFAPFFSTKPQGQGTGMGLAVVKSIVDAAKGAISLESTVGEGSTFHIALPLVEVEEKKALSDWTPPPATGKTILFVDDESSILRMAPPLLTSIGYTPVVCADHVSAREALQNPKLTIDAVITDLIMPDSNGLELAREAHTLMPDTPILILTGYPAKLDREAALTAGVRACLTKPVTRQELSESLTRIFRGENLLAAASEEEPAEHPPQRNEDPE